MLPRTVSAALNSGVPVAHSDGSVLSTQLAAFSRELAGVTAVAAPAEPVRRRSPLLGLF